MVRQPRAECREDFCHSACQNPPRPGSASVGFCAARGTISTSGRPAVSERVVEFHEFARGGETQMRVGTRRNPSVTPLWGAGYGAENTIVTGLDSGRSPILWGLLDTAKEQTLDAWNSEITYQWPRMSGVSGLGNPQPYKLTFGPNEGLSNDLRDWITQ
jgi:hypothetical protein